MSSLFKLRHLLLLLAIGLAVMLVTVVVRRYQPPVTVTVSKAALPAGVDLALDKVDYTHTEGGVARWRLVASRAEHQAESKFMLVKNLALTFFDEKGVEQMTLKALNGQINSSYSAIEVHDEVEVSHRDGYTLRTKSLRFNQGDGLIRTDDPIRLVGRDLTMDGVGLRIDIAKGRLHIPAGVRVLLSGKPS